MRSTMLMTAMVLLAMMAWPAGFVVAADAPAAPAAVAPAPAAPVESGTADQMYDIKLKQMEERIGQLKEKVFRSKARLLVLQETILKGVIAGARAVIQHTDELGSLYKLESAAYYLDGNPIFGKTDESGDLVADKAVDVYNGSLAPGNHLLTVYMTYRGQSSVFSYVEGLKIKLKSNYNFKAEEGKVTKIDVRGFDKGGITARYDKRPSIDFKVRYLDFQEFGGSQPQPQAAAPAPAAPAGL